MATPTEKTTIGQIEARNVHRLTGLACDPDPGRRTEWELRLVRTWGDGQRAEWHVGDPVCRGCGHEIDPTPLAVTVVGESLSWPITVCDSCMGLVRQHYNGQGAAPGSAPVSLTPRWDEECPPRFKEAITGALPRNVDAAVFGRVQLWRPSERKGLAIVGPSGAGKSSAFWALARALEREGVAPVVLSAVALGRLLSKAARDLEGVEWLCNCRVLMVDDLGKERATAAVGALLWELLDHRYSHGRPIVITSRFSGDELRERFGEAKLGDDIVRRLNELCVGVKFNLPVQAAA